MLGYRLPAVFVILGTMAAGVAVTVVTLLTQPPVTVDQWFFFGLFTVLSAISYVYPIQMEGDVPFSYIMAAAFLFAGALRLPAGLLSLMCYLMVIPGIFILRRPYGWFKDLFNASNYLLSAQAAAVLVHWSGYTGPFELRHLLGVIVAIAVDMALGNFLVAWVVGADHGISPFKINVWDVPYLAVDAIICAMGALIGVVSAVSPWAVVLALIPLLMPYWLLKNIHLVRQVDVDAKTGLYNHRYFSGRLPILLAHAKATARPVALLFADLDYLREVNNTYGHLAGDMVLKQVSGVMLEHTRPSDLVARWGGEEFVVILPGTTLSDARHVAERLCEAISNYTFDVGQTEPIRCTISIGVAAAPGHGWDPAELLQIADRAMYAAKAAGRNQVSIAESV